MSNETSEERDNARNSNVPQEGMDQGPARLVVVPFNVYIFVPVLCSLRRVGVSAAFALHDSLKRVPERVCLRCSLSCVRRVTQLGAHSVTVAYVSLIIQQQIA